MMAGMRRILISLPLLLLSLSSASAEQMKPEVCDKLRDALYAVVKAVDGSIKMAESLELRDRREDVGPKTRAALEQMTATRLRFQASLFEYKAASRAAAEQIASCSE
ncbi:hypothetical protein Mpop_2707 [Methylorubrum populi BJ001]|jgi:hypothetical protein|uniref:Uncharacterized protein n=1 Tax=Methylorubrum populi (strain ATCC BAA-705 / NCIMB 13946 / BJ001) TaxID=441620 RepID=B1ZCZ3_METPB|nr:hypothetical protein [Methylorubrum populi]ACB80862.1 hypothetical protein Mpop_2707 [Methylorubrum populi BJ001]